MDTETFVLIAGGGPVGLTAALELAWRGVPFLLVTQNLQTATHPKCNNTNARSLEHFRRLGLASVLRAQGLPPSVERASVYLTRFCGFQMGHLPRVHTQWPTPEPPAIVSQIALERALRQYAEERAPDAIHFGWKLLSFVHSGDGIVANVQNVTTHEERQVRARYLLGVDGASSSVRRQLGIPMQGEDGSEARAFMGGTMLSYYIHAPTLLEASGRGLTHMSWVVNAQLRAMMFLQDAGERWVVHYQVPAGQRWEDVPVREVIRDILGKDVPFEIISGGPWTGGLALVAEQYARDNVFLAGDAAHLFTPLGGFGMNTGIGDVMNLGWKLAALHAGWGGPRLLASYESERRPMGLRNVQLGVRCSRVMDAWQVPPHLEDVSTEGAAERSEFGKRMVADDAPQYLTVGLQLGERYAGSPIICDTGVAPPEDTWDRYTPADVPGGRAPHAWLGEEHALYDEFGPGYSLLDFGGSGAAALAAAAAERRVPLKVLTLPPLTPYRNKLVLVRPDQHITWCGDEVGHALEIIDRARGAEGLS